MTLTQVSQEALIRDMDAEQCKEKWDFEMSLPVFTYNQDAERCKLYYLLNKQYFQLTGEILPPDTNKYLD